MQKFQFVKFASMEHASTMWGWVGPDGLALPDLFDNPIQALEGMGRRVSGEPDHPASLADIEAAGYQLATCEVTVRVTRILSSSPPKTS